MFGEHSASSLPQLLVLTYAVCSDSKTLHNVTTAHSRAVLRATPSKAAAAEQNGPAGICRVRRLTRLWTMRRLWCDASVAVREVGVEFRTWTSNGKTKRTARERGLRQVLLREGRKQSRTRSSIHFKVGWPANVRPSATPRRLRGLKNEARRAPMNPLHR